MSATAARASSHPALDAAIDILADLVAFPSVSLQPNGDIVRYIEEVMQRNGLRCLRNAHEDGLRFNLLGSAGPPGPGVFCCRGIWMSWRQVRMAGQVTPLGCAVMVAGSMGVALLI